jgi:hypothetical protein
MTWLKIERADFVVQIVKVIAIYFGYLLLGTLRSKPC